MTELLMAYRAFAVSNSHLVAPVPASREELPLFHTAEYADAVARLSGLTGPAAPGTGTESTILERLFNVTLSNYSAVVVPSSADEMGERAGHLSVRPQRPRDYLCQLL